MGVLSKESGMKLSEVLEKLETLPRESVIEEYEDRNDIELLSEFDA